MRLLSMCALACGFIAQFSPPVMAQGSPPRLGLGVKGGVNVATQRFEGEADGPSLDPRIAVVAGVFANVPLLSWLDLQPEALFSMKGARLDLEGAASSVWLDYLELPVLARISRPAGGTRRYFAVAGPAIGVRLRARTRTDFGDSTEELDISHDLERLDLSVTAGGGVEFGRLVLDGRYTLGFKDIDNDKTDAVEVTNRAFSFTVGFRF
jgi:hypothetical protein